MGLRPYYDRNGITLYHADALAVLHQMESGIVDVVVTDPPYGTATDQRDEWMVGEFSNVTPLLLPEVYRVGVENAALYSFTSWRWMADWIMRCSQYFRMQGFLIWDKQRHSGSFGKFSWQFHWEGIYYGIKGPRPIRKYMPDILRSSEKPDRPMQKPINIIAQLIEASSDPGQVVLDPFAGSGSTLVAARELGRRAIGIEISREYCEIAVRRLEQGVLPFAG